MQLGAPLNRDSTTLPTTRRGEQLVLRLFALTQAFPGKLNALRRHEDGQTMAEYGVVLAVMTLAVLASMTLLSDNVRSAFESIAALLPG
jgi:Flp pilus assembly pilin Flp